MQPTQGWLKSLPCREDEVRYTGVPRILALWARRSKFLPGDRNGRRAYSRKVQEKPEAATELQCPNGQARMAPTPRVRGSCVTLYAMGRNRSQKNLKPTRKGNLTTQEAARTRGRTRKRYWSNRDRGKPRGPSPPTPPYMRVRIRRFRDLSP